MLTFTIVESDGDTVVDESGTTDSFTVVLDSQPASDVVFNVSSSDTGEATVNLSTLTFTNTDWDAPQTVTVTGVDDPVDDDDQASTISVVVDDDASDDAFDGSSDSVSATTTDDEEFLIVPGTAGSDAITLTLTGVNSGTIDGLAVGITFTGITSVIMQGEGGDDTLTVDLNGHPLPTGGIVFDGGVGGNDKLVVKGSGTQNAVYTPDVGTTGDGTVSVDGSAITFTGLEPVDISGMATATLALPGADDVLTVGDGKDFASGAVDAIVVAGTSGGTTIETAAFFNNTTVVIDTTTSDGNDMITVNAIAGSHANANLEINTGTGTEAITLAGDVTTTGNQSYDGPVALSADVNLTATKLTVDGTINLDVNTLTVTATSPDTHLQGVISGTGGITQAGTGHLWLDAANDYSGVTNVNAGELWITNNSSLGAVGVTSNTVVAAAGELYIAADLTVAEHLSLMGTLSVGSVSNVNAIWSGPIEVSGGSATIEANQTGDTLAISGIISGTGGLTTAGPGLAELQAVNTFTGPFTVDQYQTVVFGSIDVGADVIVKDGAGLEAGAIGGALTAESGGVLLTHGSPSSIFSTGNLDLQAGSILQLEVRDVAVPGTDYGQVDVAGTVTLGGFLNLIDANSATGSVNSTIVLIDNDGTDAVSGTFAGLPQGAEVSINSETWRILYNGGEDNNDVVLVWGKPKVSVADASVVEGNDGTATITFDVVVDSPLGSPFRVSYASAGNSSANAADYAAVNGELNFEGLTAGETQQVSIQVTGDQVVELNETFLLNLTSIQDTTVVEFSDNQAIGTITNDDAATLTITDVEMPEEDTGDKPFIFTVTLDNAVDTGVAVTYASSDGSATTADNDYTASPGGTLNFLGHAGETMTLSVNVTGDTTEEPDEDFFIDLSGLNASGRNVTLTTAQARGTITDDDRIPVNLSANLTTGTESGKTVVTLKATAADNVPSGGSFQLGVSGNGITSNDYQFSNSTIVIPAGQSEGEVTFTVEDDAVLELTETARISLANPSQFVRMGDTGFVDVTITDNDSASVSIDDVVVLESDNGNVDLLFTVTLDKAVDIPFTVAYETQDGTAVAADSDFVADSGTLNFAGGAGETQTLSISAIGDELAERDERFTVELSGIEASGRGVTLADDAGLGTIRNDDTASLRIDDVTLDEGDSGNKNFVFTVTLDADVDVPVSVDYDTVDNLATTADGDYVANTGSTLSFNGTAGETRTLAVLVSGDTKVETDEAFFVNLSNVQASGRNVTLADDDGAGTIRNDDDGVPVELSVSLNSGSESEASVVTVTATADAPVGDDQTVDLVVTGVDGTDYVLGANFIMIADGTTTGTTTFTIVDDAVVEALETATLTLQNPTVGLKLGTITSQSVSIIDNDSALLSIQDVAIGEGSDNGTTDVVFTVTLDKAVDVPVMVDYTTSNGSAIAGDDYTSNTSTLTFAGEANETQTLAVSVAADKTVELDESFFVNLSNAAASGRLVTFARNQARGTITNDDTASLTITDVSEAEGPTGTTNFVFVVTSDAATDTAFTVNYGTTDGTAESVGATPDFTAVSGGTLNFVGTAGETASIQVSVNGDTTSEVDETFHVTLSNPDADHRSVVLADAVATGTIVDDDGIFVNLTASASAGTEADITAIILTATADSNVTGDQVVNLAVSGNGITNSDYSLTETSITIPDGTNTGTVTLTIANDAIVEDAETMNIALVNPSLALSLGPNVTANVAIVDNDAATLSVEDATVVEGDDGSTSVTVTVRLSAEVDSAVTVGYETSDNSATTANDYTLTTGTLNFAGNADETQTFSVPITSDTVVELDEVFHVNLVNVQGNGRDVTTPDPQGDITISNDDAATISIDDVQMLEGTSTDPTFVFTVTLDEAVDGGVNVTADTQDDSTTAGTDYTSVSGKLIAFVGMKNETQSIAVTVAADSEAELDERFAVILSGLDSGGRNVSVIDGEGVGTIQDDDGIAVDFDVSAAAGTEVGTTKISLVASAASALPADGTVDVLVTGTGIDSQDYSLPITTIEILEGAKIGTVDFTILDDQIVEALETATITISNPSKEVSLGTTVSKTIQITSDDVASLSIDDVVIAAEGDSGTTTATFTVTLDNQLASGIKVDFETADGTAVEAEDYVAQIGTLNFAGTAGETQTVQILVNGDSTLEANETFTVNLTNLQAGDLPVSITDAEGRATITNDDGNIAVDLSADLAVGTEKDETVVTLTATTTQPTTNAETVTLEVAGTNITTGDYILSTTTITIDAGQTTGTATFTVTSDGLLEGDETAGISIIDRSAGLRLGTTTSVDVAIADQTFVTVDQVDRFPGNQPTLTWQEVPGAVRYEIWFSRIFPQQSRVYSDVNISTTEWTPPTSLDPAFYRFWIKAFDAAGAESEWSNEGNFEVKPTLIAPVIPTFNARPTFTWNVIPFAPGYEIFVRTSEGDIVETDITTTSWTPPTDLAGGRDIRWWIRSSDAQSNRGWSDVGITNVDRRTTILGPDSPTSDTTPTVFWQEIEGAGRYIVHIENTDSNEVVFREDRVLATSFTPGSPIAAGKYRAWVKAIDGTTDLFNSGLWSKAFDFTIVVAESGEPSSELTMISEKLSVVEVSYSDTDENSIVTESKVEEMRQQESKAQPDRNLGVAPEHSTQSELGLLDAVMALPNELSEVLHAIQPS